MKHEAFYKAMLARDYRFDGKFFVAVIGASGKLTGFAGGLETKARLLELEGVNFS